MAGREASRSSNAFERGREPAKRKKQMFDRLTRNWRRPLISRCATTLGVWARAAGRRLSRVDCPDPKARRFTAAFGGLRHLPWGGALGAVKAIRY
jgi:hypothetical protein